MSRTTALRRKQIEELITLRHIMSVQALSDELAVSKETIRKDLAYLEEKGSLYRTHGGARERSNNIDIPYDIRSQEYIQEKRRIAKEVPAFIHDDDIVYVDACSTAAYLGVLLKQKKHLTFVTNSLEMVASLQDSGHKIIMTGGTYIPEGKRLSGDLSMPIINSLFFDVCIFGMDGCRELDGPANMRDDEMMMNKAILERSHKAILLSDASKFERYAHYQYAKFSQFDVFITTQLNKDIKAKLSIPYIIET